MRGSDVSDRVRWRDTGADLARALGTEGPPTTRVVGSGRALPPVGQRALAWKLAWPVLIALALVGPALAAWVYLSREQLLAERRQHDVDLALARWAEHLSDQVAAFAEALQVARGLYDASDVVRRDEFGLFTSRTLERHRALRVMAWAPLVERWEREAFERTADPDRPATLWVATDAPPRLPSAAPHVPVHYAVPALLYPILLGLDLRGDELRGRLVERALATGAPVLSEPLQVVPSDALGSGALMGLRVAYSDAGAGARGMLLLGFRFEDLLQHCAARLAAERAGHLAVTLFGREGEGRERPLGTVRAGLGMGPASPEAEALESVVVLEVCGQRWRLRGRPTERFLEGGPQDSPGWIAAGALVGWEVLLAAVAALVAGWHATLMRRQSTLVDHVLRNLDEAVVVADRRGRIRMANEAALSILAVPIGEDGQPRWPDRLHFRARGAAGTAPARQPLERAIAGEDVEEAIYTLHVPYANAPREVAVSGHPVVDETGALHGGMLVIRDVTAQLALQQKAVAMEVAGGLQRRQFPTAPPPGLDLDLAGTVLAAEETSGDGYDWMLDAAGRLVLTISDVRDHGLPAAMLMMSARAYVRSQVAAGQRPDATLARVNASLAAELQRGDFVTMLCVEVDPTTRRVRYANAGHPAGLLLGPRGELLARLTSTGPLLGVFADAGYRLEEAPPLLPGRTLVLLTDGVLECADRRERRFEEQRLVEVLARHAQQGAGQVVEAVLAALRGHAGEGPPQDDITVVVLKG